MLIIFIVSRNISLMRFRGTVMKVDLLAFSLEFEGICRNDQCRSLGRGLVVFAKGDCSIIRCLNRR